MNPAGEAQALTEAAREFIIAELDNVNLKCPSFQEHLTAAINCYSHAIRVSLAIAGLISIHCILAASRQNQSLEFPTRSDTNQAL